MEYATKHRNYPPLEDKVEEGRENEGKDGGRQTTDECQTKLKARNPNCYAPRNENQESAQDTDHCPAADLVVRVLGMEGGEGRGGEGRGGEGRGGRGRGRGRGREGDEEAGREFTTKRREIAEWSVIMYRISSIKRLPRINAGPELTPGVRTIKRE